MHQALRALLVTLLLSSPAFGQGTPPETTQLDLLIASADSAWRAGQHDRVITLYGVIVARDPDASLAVFRRATALAYRDRLPEAIVGFRRYVQLEPNDDAGRNALARTLAWAARYRDAVAVYDSVLARNPADRDAALGAAQTLAWASRFSESLARYDAWTTAHPEDTEARLGYARALSWAGRLSEAERIYRALAALGASDDAEKGIARVLGWRGALSESEAQWRTLTARLPRDPEAWTGLAQVLRWQGRTEEAEQALRQALAVQPGYADARLQLAWVLAELRPSVEPSVIGGNDSDRNRTVLYSLAASAPAPWSGRMVATASQRIATLPGIEGRATTFKALASWSKPGGTLALRGEVGGALLRSQRVAAPAIVHQKALATLRAAWRPSARASVGVTASTVPFDETALLVERGIVMHTAGVDGEVAMPRRIIASAAAEFATLTGGTTTNHRRAGSAAVRWNQSRRLSLAIGARAFGYDSTTRDGYFAPERYAVVETSARLQVGKELGWRAGGEVAVGQQAIRVSGGMTTSRVAERLRGWLTWRPVPGYEVMGSVGWTNVAQPGQLDRGEYNATTLSLTGRVRL